MLCGRSWKSFNKQDVNASMLFSVDYGIATDAIDPTLRTKESTVMKQAMRSQLMIENLGEELRVLYVAMTRAREKLYLTGAKDHLLTTWKRKFMRQTRQRVNFHTANLRWQEAS